MLERRSLERRGFLVVSIDRRITGAGVVRKICFGGVGYDSEIAEVAAEGHVFLVLVVYANSLMTEARV